jgi:hypothetical protein
VVGCEISNLSNFVAAKQLSAVVGQKNSSLLNFVKFRNEALWLVEDYPTSQISQLAQWSALVGLKLSNLLN